METGVVGERLLAQALLAAQAAQIPAEASAYIHRR
jgi:hypothetical protein